MPNKQIADDLRAARALIESPGAWTKGEFARDSDGDGIEFSELSVSGQATCFCALGAVGRAVNFDQSRYDAAKTALQRLVPRGRLTAFNDAFATTHADILALFDRAIAAAEA